MAKRKKPITVTIDRRKWVRGSSPRFGASELLNDRGELCCLGFLGRACGVPDRDLQGTGMPDVEFYQSHNRYPDLLIDGEDFAIECASVNDRSSKHMSDSKRESAVKRLFAKMDIKVKFIGPPLSKLPLLNKDES